METKYGISQIRSRILPPNSWVARTLHVRECEQEGSFETRTYNVRAIRSAQQCATEFEKTSTKHQVLTFFGILSLLISCAASECPAAEFTDALKLADKAIQESMAQLEVSKNEEGLLLLTNAYYSRINGQGAEPYRDLLSETTGCTTGKRSLLDVHTAVHEPLWFALCRKSSHKLVFCRWGAGSFQCQTIDAAPEKLLDVETWKRTSDGPIGAQTLFQVASIALGWAAGTDWSILKVAGFHDQLAPGVNMGFLFHAYLEKRMPQEKGDEWRFFGALPKCYMDSLQVLYDATLGKGQSLGLLLSPEQLSKYKANGAMPCIVALKVNNHKDTCQGMVLGFSRKQVMGDLGVREADLDPQGDPNNPVFCIARIKACVQMAKMKQEDQVKWIAEMRRFSGKADLARQVCNAGGDPYAILWNK